MRSWDLMHEVIASMPVVITEVTPMRDDDEEQVTPMEEDAVVQDEDAVVQDEEAVVQAEAVVQEEEAVVQVTPMRDRLAMRDPMRWPSYVVTDCRAPGKPGLYRMTWGQLETAMGVGAGLLAGRLGKYGVRLRKVQTEEEAQRYWGATWGSAPMPMFP